MPPQPTRLSGGVFFPLSPGEFEQLLGQTTLRRQIDSVHLHHTWRPRHADFAGVSSIIGMWRFHTQQQGWSDIAQHLTVDPNGTLWTGRHWDNPPASAKGFNGSALSGPFMIEMVGDFDIGQDVFQDPQREAVITTVSLLLNKFGLPVSSVRFHKEMSAKTCPGTGIERVALLNAIDSSKPKRTRASRNTTESPFPKENEALTLASQFLHTVSESAVQLGDVVVASGAEVDQELPEAEPAGEAAARVRTSIQALEIAARELRDVDVTLTAGVKDSLKPYVVNLTNGRFSTTGEFTTSQADVDAIFDEHMPKALQQTANGTPFRIVVFAHGGLVGEKDGLGVALKHVDWWRANGVYPIYFAWETGLLSTLINLIRQHIPGGRAADGQRDAADAFDALIEAAARKGQANRIWRDMKHVAELSSAGDGGARYVAQRLSQFCGAHGSRVQVHAIGHSAGSNFHGFFVPRALEAGVPMITTLQFLAPAMTVDNFFAQVSPVLGRVGPLTIFTMKDSFEQDDSCGGLYNKSLLYLIFHCLEEVRETDLLGLERSVRADLRLKRMLGLDGTPSPRGHEVVWSITSGDRRASSESTRHGGFDDDPATMNSVLRRVLNLSGADEVPREFVAPPRAVDVEVWSRGGAVETSGPSPYAESPAVLAATPAGPSAAAHRTRGLCVGINAYRRNPLNGCVADAQLWAETMARLGVEVRPVLRDTQATRANILSALQSLIQHSQRGDAIVFQFSGHGTTLPDISGDEVSGDSPGLDEALCPHDFTEGRFIVDDDLREVFEGAAAKDVAITSFIDCCHSGTISRLGVGTPSGAVSRRDGDDRPRFVEPLPGEIDAYRSFRLQADRSRRGTPRAGQRDVLFSACRSTEVAWESSGHGDFTRHATAALRRQAPNTNGALLATILQMFGANPRQHPELHPSTAAALRLFTPTVAASEILQAGMDQMQPSLVVPDAATLLRTIADFISRDRS